MLKIPAAVSVNNCYSESVGFEVTTVVASYKMTKSD